MCGDNGANFFLEEERHCPRTAISTLWRWCASALNRHWHNRRPSMFFCLQFLISAARGPPNDKTINRNRIPTQQRRTLAPFNVCTLINVLANDHPAAVAYFVWGRSIRDIQEGARGSPASWCRSTAPTSGRTTWKSCGSDGSREITNDWLTPRHLKYKDNLWQDWRSCNS